jgi:23S rRNA (pseudouridine1915-N3)-methyltransferase
MKIFLYYVGKPRDPNANGLAEEYIRRINRYTRCEMREVQPARFDPQSKHPSAMRVLLDPSGNSMDSIQFAKHVGKTEQESRDLVYVIGGANGLPAHWRHSRDLLLSLSPLTMSHELARAMLAEQIYRAFTILRGHPYAK